MKRIMACVGMALLLIGCKNLPTPEKMESTSKSVGYTTGLVVKKVVTKEKSINAITNIMTMVSTCVPTNGQKFVEVWTPIAEKYVDTLIQKQKIDAAEGSLILLGTQLTASGIDYIFDNIYPKARGYEELVNAAARGFTAGFMNNFNGSKEVIEVDKELYEKLLGKAK